MFELKIAYYSVSPFTPTGFGVCTRYLCYHLAAKHEVHIFSYFGYEGEELDFRMNDRTVKIIGGNGTLYHPTFFERYREYDVQILHFDAWVMSQRLAKLVDANMIHWAILDSVPVQRPYIPYLASPGVKVIVPMSKFGKEVLTKCPKIPDEKIADPIPHGADPNVFYPEKNPEVPFIPKDAEFVVVSVIDNNGIRENVAEVIEAFAIFLRMTKADAYLYLHTDPIKNMGYNLHEIIDAIEELYEVKIRDRVIFKPTKQYFTADEMRHVYSRADVLLIPVKGGSFEIPIIEAGLCETPSIVTEFGAPAELIGEQIDNLDYCVVQHERGLAVEPVASMWMNLTSAKQAILNAHDIADALWAYYNDEELRKKHGKAMREWVLENCTWEIVGKMWLKLLDEYDGRNRE